MVSVTTPGRQPPTGAAHDVQADRRVHILLLGLVGAGKSTVGRIVANGLSRPYVDSDSIVTLRTGSPPHSLVDANGVDELYRVEFAVTREVLSANHAVILAAAASAIDELELDDLEHVWAVWLETTPETLAQRVRPDDPRLRAAPTPLDALTAQYEARNERGRALADLVVDTDHRSPSDVADDICRAWHALLDGREQFAPHARP